MKSVKLERVVDVNDAWELIDGIRAEVVFARGRSSLEFEFVRTGIQVNINAVYSATKRMTIWSSYE